METRRQIKIESGKQFNLIIADQAGYAHTEAFREVGERIEEELRQADASYVITEKAKGGDYFNIILGGHVDPGMVESCDPKSTLILNLERLAVNNGTPTDHQYLQILRKYRYIDFASRNISFCEENNLPKPLYLYRPWHESKWQRTYDVAVKTWDACFIGSLTPRRASIIKSLREAGLNVASAFNCYSSERDEILSKSKYILNIHAYEEDHSAELWRLNYYASNNLRVISETSLFEEGEAQIDRHLTQYAYTNFVDGVIKTLETESTEDRISVAKQFHDACTSLEGTTEHRKYAPKPTAINIGCGTNWREDAINIDIKKTGFEDLVIDISSEWAAINKRYTCERYGNIYINNKGFDAIEAVCVLEHIENLKAALENIVRLLKPGGWLHLKFPHQDSLGAWQDPTHVRGMNENLFKYLGEWGYYLDLRDARMRIKWLNFTENASQDNVDPQENTNSRRQFVEALLVKVIVEKNGANPKEVIQESKNYKKRVGLASLQEELHRKTYLAVDEKKSIEGTKSISVPNVSLLTPTFGNRFKFLALASKWVLQQDYPRDLMEWIILTDNEDEREYLQKAVERRVNRDLKIRIHSCKDKMPIGWKRNRLNKLSEGDIMVNIDDDDYYFPNRVSHAIDVLQGKRGGKHYELAGSQRLPIFFTDDRSMWVSDPGPNVACAGSFAYKRSILKKTWYPSQSVNGEEIAFTNHWSIPKADLDPFSTMVCIAHRNNTFDKDILRKEFSKGSESRLYSNKASYLGDRNFFQVGTAKEINPDSNVDQWIDMYVELAKNQNKQENEANIFGEPEADSAIDRLVAKIIGKLMLKTV